MNKIDETIDNLKTTLENKDLNPHIRRSLKKKLKVLEDKSTVLK